MKSEWNLGTTLYQRMDGPLCKYQIPITTLKYAWGERFSTLKILNEILVYLLYHRLKYSSLSVGQNPERKGAAKSENEPYLSTYPFLLLLLLLFLPCPCLDLKLYYDVAPPYVRVLLLTLKSCNKKKRKRLKNSYFVMLIYTRETDRQTSVRRPQQVGTVQTPAELYTTGL